MCRLPKIRCCSDTNFLTPPTEGAQLDPNAKNQARAEPNEPFATTA